MTTTEAANHGTILITGASSGIGRELALAWIQRRQAANAVTRMRALL